MRTERFLQPFRFHRSSSPEHRELHLSIFRRLNNPFVVGLLEAYWDAYEAVELNTYADIAYLEQVWDYHERMVEAIAAGDAAHSKQLLIEHMQLLSQRGISIESRQRDSRALVA